MILSILIIIYKLLLNYQGKNSNLRPSGYEPDALPLRHPDYKQFNDIKVRFERSYWESNPDCRNQNPE